MELIWPLCEEAYLNRRLSFLLLDLWSSTTFIRNQFEGFRLPSRWHGALHAEPTRIKKRCSIKSAISRGIQKTGYLCLLTIGRRPDLSGHNRAILSRVLGKHVPTAKFPTLFLGVEQSISWNPLPSIIFHPYFLALFYKVSVRSNGGFPPNITVNRFNAMIKSFINMFLSIS